MLSEAARGTRQLEALIEARHGLVKAALGCGGECKEPPGCGMVRVKYVGLCGGLLSLERVAESEQRTGGGSPGGSGAAALADLQKQRRGLVVRAALLLAAAKQEQSPQRGGLEPASEREREAERLLRLSQVPLCRVRTPSSVVRGTSGACGESTGSKLLSDFEGAVTKYLSIRPHREGA